MIAAASPAVESRLASMMAVAWGGQEAVEDEPTPWRTWLDLHFSAYITAPFGERHLRFWAWITGIQRGVRPRARVEVWPRGGGKSSSIELACAYLGAQPKPVRRYALYVSDTQEQANRHVQAVAGMFEVAGVERATNAYGASKGWRREEIRTATGFNVSAFGLDAGMRGIKLDQYRPDLIIMDDIDGRHDTPATVQKKIEVITDSILPSGSTDVAVVIVQNKIHSDSIVSQLCDGRADFLHDRLPAVVEPAVQGLAYERRLQPDGTHRWFITEGDATWAGQSIETCEQQLNDWGVNAFEREAQHNVARLTGGLWDMGRDIEPFRVTTKPKLHRIVVAVDPNTEEGGDEAGIVVAGISNFHIDHEGVERWSEETHGYVLDDATVSGGPKSWAEAAVAVYSKYDADAMIAEVNNGGEMVAITIKTVPGGPSVKKVRASRGKQTRAEPIQKLYSDGRVHHLGRLPALEREQCTWKPPMPSPNRLDAVVWALTDLMVQGSVDVKAVKSAFRH